MLDAILFNDPKKFKQESEYNYIDTITDNCIILCEDTGVKCFLAQQIEDICTGKHKESGYDYWADSPLNITDRFEYLPTTIFEIDEEQKISITIEPPFVLTANSPADIWFAIRDMENKVAIYPFRLFKGFNEVWESGIQNVYKSVISGKFGCYDGFSHTVNNTPIGKE